MENHGIKYFYSYQYSGNETKALELIENGANANVSDQLYRQNPMHLASRNGTVNNQN